MAKKLLESIINISIRRSTSLFEEQSHSLSNLQVSSNGRENKSFSIEIFLLQRKIIDLLHSIYKIEVKVGSVRYPEKFAQKILLMFRGDLNLFSQALEQVTIFSTKFSVESQRFFFNRSNSS